MSNASKFIMWFLIIAGVTTSGLWIAGGKNNEYSTALEIDDAPDMVFSFLTEPKKLKTWVTGLLEVGQFEPNKGNSGDPSSYIKTPRARRCGPENLFCVPAGDPLVEHDQAGS